MRPRLHRFLLAAAIGFLYLYPFPYFPEIHSANELPRVYLTRAMVEEGTFAIDSGIERWGATADVSPHGKSTYSNKAPGSSFFAVPAYVLLKGAKSVVGGEPELGEMMWTFRVFTGVVPTLLFLLLLWRFLRRFVPSPESRRLVVAGYALGSMAMTYSLLFIAHQLAAVCIATAWILCVRVVEEGYDERWLLAAGLVAGCAPLVDYQAAFAGVPVAVYLLWHLLARKPRRWKGALLAAAGAIPPIALLLVYHWRAFGHPLRTGYAASKTFAHFHQSGFLGMDGFRLEAFVGSTVAPSTGLLFLSPMFLLAIPGFVFLARRRLWWHLGVTLSVVLLYLAFISSLSFWTAGWKVGPRYITAMLPFALLPIAACASALEARWPLRALVVALVAVSVVIYATTGAEFPHFPHRFVSLSYVPVNPVYEFTFRLIAEGHAAPNAGWLLGLRGLASLIPYLAVLGALLVWLAIPTRRHLRSGIAGLALAAVILALYSIPGGTGEKAERAYQWIRAIVAG